MGVMSDRLSFFHDLDSLKVMLVLYRDNPDVDLEELRREARLDPAALSNVLAELIKAELVHVRTENGEQLFTLSQEARMALNRLDAPAQLLSSTV
ncbi:hypothetical protein HYV43_05515 [Candidatus Micrarchaeota archaeon]|nr:hypothetical protein [Candidatus Micrarchaeota archaeon]